MMDWFNIHAPAIQALSAIAQAIFSLALIFVGAGQWFVYQKQRRVMEQTREIAYAALNRPYILIESASHNRNEWRDGAGHLSFRFRLQNFGNGPGIVRELTADVIVSNGIGGSRAEDGFPVKQFPDPDWLDSSLIDRAPVVVDPDARLSPFGRTVGTLVLAPEAISPLLGQSCDLTYYAPATPIHIPRVADYGPSDRYPDFQDVRRRCGSMPVWLIGKVIYEDILGRRHHTRFCFRGGHDNNGIEEYGPPYNQRT